MAKTKTKVLLVDDEPDFLDVMHEAIGFWGYDVVTASNGKKALEMVRSESPAIVVLDYQMPGMNGIETLKKLRVSRPSLPVILFTAYPNDDNMENALGLRVSAFVPKLCEYSQTQSALKNALKLIEKNLNTKPSS